MPKLGNCPPIQKFLAKKRRCKKCVDTFIYKLAQLSPIYVECGLIVYKPMSCKEVASLKNAEKKQPKKLHTDTGISYKKNENTKFCSTIIIASFKYTRDADRKRTTIDVLGREQIILSTAFTNARIIAERYELDQLMKAQLILDSSAFFSKQLSHNTKVLSLTELHGVETTISDISHIPEENLRRKAMAKYFTQSYVPYLIQYEKSFLTDSYKRTQECCSELYQNGQKVTARYCKQRWCLVCNRIRTAKLLNGYLPQIEQMLNPQLVTLTSVNTPDTDNGMLRAYINYMNFKLRQVYKKVHKEANKKRNNKFELPYLHGLKKIECTYNMRENTFHPHYHIIIDGEQQANMFRNEWYKLIKADKIKIDWRGQDVRPITNEGGAKELFKYFTKILTKTGEWELQKFKEHDSGYITTIKKEKVAFVIPALNSIFESMAGKRTFEPYGIKAIKEDIDGLEAEQYAHLQYKTLTWQWNGQDWLHGTEFLSKYQASEEFKEMLKNVYY